MRTYAIIPARGGSKGLPRKNLRRIGGKPLLEIAVEKALRAPGVCNVYVSTEDKEIAYAALRAGARVIPRPPELATDETPTAPVLRHAVDWIKESGDRVPDAVALVYPTSPLLSPGRIGEAIRLFATGGYDSVVSVEATYGHYWTPTGIRLHPLKPENRQYAQPCYVENGAVYVMTPELLREGQLLGGRVGFVVMQPEETIDIDSPADLERARAMYLSEMVMK